MRSILLLLLLCSQMFSQTPLADESEEPDENAYVSELFAKIFQPLDLKSVDSIELQRRGFSETAIHMVLDWQHKGTSLAGQKRLKRNFSGRDKQLFVQFSQLGSGYIFRQRLQYSPSLEGWRILNKSRVFRPWGTFIMLFEQDPGESRLNDHAILSASIQKLPFLKELIIGSFNISWGGGSLLNQQGYRSSLAPNSLLYPSQIRVRPHYSSREIDYFKGMAGVWETERIRGTVFISHRTALGTGSHEDFREDSDGIHPSGKSYDSMSLEVAGVAGEYDFSTASLFTALLVDRQQLSGAGLEAGLTWRITPSQNFQGYVTGRLGSVERAQLTWAYRTPEIQLAIQFRNYFTEVPLASGATLSMLGSSASNETGISIRTQIRPIKGSRIRYAMDTGASYLMESLSAGVSVRQHKVQFILDRPQRQWQLDGSHKREGPVILSDDWEPEFGSITISKQSISLLEKIVPGLQYRLNLKTAHSQGQRSYLIQQRTLLSKDAWKGGVGYTRYAIPNAQLRISTYESSLVESFSFFTAFNDGERWFFYLNQTTREWIDLELKIASTRTNDENSFPGQVEISFQMSIVL